MKVFNSHTLYLSVVSQKAFKVKLHLPSRWCAINQMIIITKSVSDINRNSRVRLIVQAKVKVAMSFVTKSPPVMRSIAATQKELIKGKLLG